MLTYDGTPEPVWSADEDWIGRELDDLQYVTAEGPAYDTARSGRAVLVPDLLEEADGRWHQFRPDAIRHGAAALFAFPVTFGMSVGGVLSGYRTTPGHLTLQQVNGAWFFAQAVALLLVKQLDTSIDDLSMPGSVLLHRAEIHRAAGILAEHFNIPVQQALDRLRAHAYGEGRPLRDVAHEVVSSYRRPNFRFPF
ncbi:ANTAR domain-containing protein [Streptomyces sp. NPDC057620]|uniref:ANTAR domain-containing protein n=1 Tax=Streptomyces sp. NPDC057620 TaxID=3346185 RepID=UPI00368E6E4B